jgi:hypothetical protein
VVDDGHFLAHEWMGKYKREPSLGWWAFQQRMATVTSVMNALVVTTRPISDSDDERKLQLADGAAQSFLRNPPANGRRGRH